MLRRKVLGVFIIVLAGCSDNKEAYTEDSKILENSVVLFPVVVSSNIQGLTVDENLSAATKAQNVFHEQALFALKNGRYQVVEIETETSSPENTKISGQIAKVWNAFDIYFGGAPFFTKKQQQDFMRRYTLYGELQLLCKQFGVSKALLIKLSVDHDQSSELKIEKDLNSINTLLPDSQLLPQNNKVFYSVSTALIDGKSSDVLWSTIKTGEDVQEVASAAFDIFPASDATDPELSL